MNMRGTWTVLLGWFAGMMALFWCHVYAGEPCNSVPAVHADTAFRRPDAIGIGQAYSADGHTVVRGVRPPIGWDAIDDDAMERGVLRIKFTFEMTAHLEEHAVTVEKDGTVSFGIAELDTLNLRHGVHGARPYFRTRTGDERFADRHIAWGLHLWYELQVDKNADILQLINDYERLPEVQIAEPSFKKRQIVGAAADVFVPPDVVGMEYRGYAGEWIPDDPGLGHQWHYHNTGQHGGVPGADIGLLPAWEMEKGHPDVVVAIIDDGIQYDHPDLAANMWQHHGYPYHGFNFVENSPHIIPGNHGTHVAGTVAAVNNNGTGVAGIAGGSGTGDGVRLMSAQVFAENQAGGFADAMVWAADNGAAISQNSWGYVYPGVYEHAVLNAIDYFNVNGGGDVMTGGITIFAAGNANTQGNWYPACYPGVLSVAATNNQDQKAWYSTYDSWVDVSAPGGETNHVTERGVYSTVTGDGYAWFQGTSMACPHVSGAAALLISYAHRNGLSMDNTKLKDLLVDNTDDNYGENPVYAGRLGSGRLNVFRSLAAAEDILRGIVNPTGFSATAAGQDAVYLEWTVNDQGHDVMLVWSPDNTFGIPENGVEYAPGQTVPGGGTVLSHGSGNSFLHGGLNPASHYYYKAFSYDASGNYSSGRTARALTDCNVISALPFAERFDGNTLPTCWSQTYESGNVNWQVGKGNGWNNPSFPYEGNNNVYFKITSSPRGRTSRLITPRLALAAYTGVQLSFHYVNQAWYGDQDVLRVYYRYAPAGQWVLLDTFDENVSEWTRVELDIPNDALSNTFYIAFEGEANWGYGVCIDAVALTGEPADMYAGFSAYPKSVETGEPVTFTDASEGENIHSRQWDFGEGALPSTATGKGPHVVTYGDPGKKTVRLTINGETTLTEYDYITVTASAPAGPTDLSAEVINGNNVSLSWNAPAVDAEHRLANVFSGGYDDPSGVPGGPHAEMNMSYLYKGLWYSAGGTPRVRGYRVYRDSAVVAHIPDPKTTHFIDRDLQEGLYAYFVTAEYASPHGESAPSETEIVCVEQELPPTVWTGKSSDRWDNGENWSDGVPEPGRSALIPGGLSLNYPTVSQNAHVRNLKLESGATLLGEGNLTIHGEFIMEYGMPYEAMHLVSAPVKEMTIIGSDFVPEPDMSGMLPGGFSFFSFDEGASSHPWINIRNAGAAVNPHFDEYFVAGKGYMVSYCPEAFGETSFSFRGRPNRGDIRVDLDYTEVAQQGWNLIGNPYPSGIDWGVVDRSGLEDDFAYVYSSEKEQYLAVEHGIIPANKGFFVKAADRQGSITFTDNVRVHGGSCSGDHSVQNALVLKLSRDSLSDHTSFRVIRGTEFGRDRRDALKRFSHDPHVPQLYSYTADGVKVSINSIPHIDTKQMIPVGIRTPAAGQYSVSIHDTDSSFSGYIACLEDFATGAVHKLKEKTEYVFYAGAGDDPTRFGLHFVAMDDDPTDIDDPGTILPVSVWYHDNLLYVETTTDDTEIAVYEISGQMLHTFRQPAGHQSYPLRLPAGIYIVTTRSDLAVKSFRIIAQY